MSQAPVVDPALLASRLRRIQRHKARIAQTPALSDSAPLGSGPPNRHGMPRLPPGQSETRKWPVLDLGIHPEMEPEAWTLHIDGAVQQPCVLDWAGLLALPVVEEASDFHCVTTWSQLDLTFGGVRLSTVLALADPRDDATHLMCHGSDGYTVNLPLEEALKDDVLVAFQVGGAPLPREHGGPVRVVTPQLWAWKGAKWICRLELLTADQRGYWEERGYSNTAHPWRDDRYG